jgi:glycosyltransferase involved in cell wall biosynthesis
MTTENSQETTIPRSDLVSIGFPVFNCIETVESALGFLVAQDYSNIEILISDNGSDDGTREYCEQMAAQHSIIKLHAYAENQGVNENHKQVIRMASGNYFMFGSGDDIWEPSFVRKNLQKLKESPDCVLCMCNVLRRSSANELIDVMQFDGPNSPQFQSPLEFMRTIILKHDRNGTLLKNNLYIHGVYRTEPIADAILNLGFERTNERDTLCRVAAHGDFCHVDETLFKKTMQDLSFSSRHPDDKYTKTKATRGTIAFAVKTSLGILRAENIRFSRRLLSIPLFFAIVSALFKSRLRYSGYRYMQQYVPKKLHPLIRTLTGRSR